MQHFIFVLRSRNQKAGKDHSRGHVVVAENAQKAREVVAMIRYPVGATIPTNGFNVGHGEEGKDVWLSDILSSCILLGKADLSYPRIVLTEFQHSWF